MTLLPALNFPSRPGWAHTAWSLLGGHCRSTPSRNTAGIFHLNTDLRQGIPTHSLLPIPPAPLEPLHSRYGSAGLIWDKTLPWSILWKTTTSIMALEKVSEIIISIKIPPSICFKLSSTITEPREQWSGWEEPCCQTLTSKAWTSTAALYYVLYLMKMPRLPHFFAIREALTKTWTCVCCAPELLMAAASAIGYSTTKQNSKCFCRRISIPSCSPQC